MSEISSIHSPVHRRDFPSEWQSRASAVVFFLPAAFELCFGGQRYYEILYLPLMILWACRLPLWTAIGGGFLVSLLLAMTSLESPLELLTTASVSDGLRRFAVLGVAAALTAHLSRARDRERQLARRDALTGLANRMLFIETVEAEADRSRRFGKSMSLAYIDCDQFKALNDSRGHAAGDRLLCLIARTLESSTRKYDLAARLGGDEFALLIADAALDVVEPIARRILDDIHAAIQAEARGVTVSMGVATFSEPEPSADALIHEADAAMYEAKQSGPGRLVTRAIGRAVLA